jgi:hypothetical protein
MARNVSNLQMASLAKGLLVLEYCLSHAQYQIAVSKNQSASFKTSTSACK